MSKETRRQVLEEPFGVTPERMFEVLTSPTAIRSWWGATSVVIDPRKGGSWVTATGDEHKKAEWVNSFSIKEYDPPNRMDGSTRARPVLQKAYDDLQDLAEMEQS